jgi:colicin import membrane protein
MKGLDTIHKRKSATITAILMMMLLLCIFFFGLKYMDPPIESGIAVNFGTSNVGSGNIQPLEPVKTEVNPEVVEKVVEEVEQDTSADETLAEDVVTQESEESIRIKKEQAVKRKAAEAEREAKAEVDRKKKEQEGKKRKLDELMGGLNNSDGSASGGEGDDAIGGDKGSADGDPNAYGYYGNVGSGGNGDYQLGDRKALSKPLPKYDCGNVEGVVVISVLVNNSGKVVKATLDLKKSNTSEQCLVDRAIEAAKNTTWDPDSKVGNKQYGSIRYNFSLFN